MSQDTKDISYDDSHAALSSWVVGRVEQWEDHRNTNYLQKWDGFIILILGLNRIQDIG